MHMHQLAGGYIDFPACALQEGISLSDWVSLVRPPISFPSRHLVGTQPMKICCSDKLEEQGKPRYGCPKTAPRNL
jgi:hypothetical protein